MDYARLIESAFRLTRAHRSIWWFGVIGNLFQGGLFLVWIAGGAAPALLAEPQPSGSNLFGSGTGTGVGPWLANNINQPVFLALVIFIILVLVLIAILVSIFCRAAIIGLARDAEHSGRATVRSGIEYGWRNLLPLIAISLLVYLGFLLAVVVLFAVVLSPLLLLAIGNQSLSVIGVVLIALLGILGLVLWLAGIIVMAIVEPLIVRNRVLRGESVFGSISNGFHLGPA